MTAAIRALILDADGVLQHPPPGWLVGWARMGGPRFVEEVHREELQTLTGQADLAPLVTQVLQRRGLDLTFEQVLDHWCRIELDERMLQLVDRVRAAGVLVAMGTNQNPYRGQFMLDNLPYAEHFDAIFHSWQMGLAKPDVAFLGHIVAALGVEPQEAVFVDDMAANAAAARAAGLHGIHWSRLDTYGELRARLRAVGVPGL